MEGWLEAALDYVPRWIELQRQLLEQPGCAVAVAHRGEVVLEAAFGLADIASGEPLTPRHRFRVASHSKSFTATGILKLRDQGRLRLDDAAGVHVSGLHDAVAGITIAQLLSHSAGLVRDGADAGQFSDRRSFLDERELRAELAEPPPLEPSVRFKYSNHGFGLLGLVIGAVAGESYDSWIMREVVAAAGLGATSADIGVPSVGPMASGHSTRLPLGRRLVIPGDNPTHAMASATGFVSTAGDLARFFAQLSPKAPRSVLSVASRREMMRRLWRDRDTAFERYYGLGLVGGQVGDWEWFGHPGSFQGFITRTALFPEPDLTVSVLTNAIDGPAQAWLEGIAHILRAFARDGAPADGIADWAGRWWTLWNPVDLVAMGKKVLAFNPCLQPPFSEASEIAVTAPDAGEVARAPGFASPGEKVRRVRGPAGEVSEIWIGGGRLAREREHEAQLLARYEC